MKRKDIHRPSGIRPADYKILFAYSRPGSSPFAPGWNFGLLKSSFSGQPEKQRVVSFSPSGGIVFSEIEQDYGRKLDYFRSPLSGSCHCCGAQHLHGSVFEHESGQAIVLGHICAAKLDFADAPKDFYDAKKRAAKIRKTLKAHKDRRAALRDWARENRDLLPFLRFNHRITQDIRRRVIRWPATQLSQAQIVLLKRLPGQEADRAERKAREDEQKRPVPKTDERLLIEGMILTTKVQDSDFGSQLKMLVRVEMDDDGFFKLWGTVPAAIEDLLHGPEALTLRGSRISFCAKIQPSRDDPSFGFFSRPTKAVLLQKADT